MKKIFIDANILIDFFNKKSSRNNECKHLLNTIFNNYVAVTSPTCFAITYYFGKKSIRNKEFLNNQIQEFFAVFTFSMENDLVMKKVLKDNIFLDLEDALQYYSSKTIDVDAIITYNKHDYYAASLPIYYPIEFLLLHFDTNKNP